MYTRYPIFLPCNCCGYMGVLKFLVSYCERDQETIKSPCGYQVHDILQPWGVAYELLQCISCGAVILIKIQWHDNWKPEDYKTRILHVDAPGTPGPRAAATRKTDP